MEVNMKLTAAVLRALINAMKRRCAGFPLGYEIETTTIETAEEMLETIEKSLQAPGNAQQQVQADSQANSLT